MRRFTKLSQIKDVKKPALDLAGKDLIPDYSIKFIPQNQIAEYTTLRTMAIEEEFRRTQLGKDQDKHQALNYNKPKVYAPIQNRLKSQMVALRGEIYLRWKQSGNLVEFKIQ